DLVRTATRARNPRSMLTGAECALVQLSDPDPWRSYALLLQGVAAALLDDGERAEVLFEQAVGAAERAGAIETWTLALTEHALLLDARGDHAAAEASLAHVTSTETGCDRFASYALSMAASART